MSKPEQLCPKPILPPTHPGGTRLPGAWLATPVAQTQLWGERTPRGLQAECEGPHIRPGVWTLSLGSEEPLTALSPEEP